MNPDEYGEVLRACVSRMQRPRAKSIAVSHQEASSILDDAINRLVILVGQSTLTCPEHGGTHLESGKCGCGVERVPWWQLERARYSDEIQALREQVAGLQATVRGILDVEEIDDTVCEVED